MGKARKSIESNVNSVSPAGAAERQKEIMAGIAMPVSVGRIHWSRVFSDKEFNTRDAESSYEVGANKDLLQSLKTFGLEMRGDMMSFSLKSGTIEDLSTPGDPIALVLVGNLRHAMMSVIRNREITRRAEKPQPEDEGKELPFEYIFGVVYSNLNRAAETAIMADHGIRKGLNDYEWSLQIGKVMEGGYIPDNKMADYFGMEKNKARRLRYRYAMPTVLDEFRKEHTKGFEGDYIKVGNEQLEELHSAYLKDYEDSGKYRVEGPHFRAVWNAILANPDAHKRSVKNKEEKPREQKTVLDHMASLPAVVGNAPELESVRNVLRWAANIKDGEKVPSLTESVQSIVDSSALIREERDGLRDIVESLRADVADRDADIIRLRDTIAHLKEETANLNDEIRDRDTLIAELRQTDPARPTV